MPDYYRAGISHPLVTELVPDVPRTLFAQMDAVADSIRKNPMHVNDDDQFAFRQLQKMLLPDLSRDEFLDMYMLWNEHYAGKQFIDEDEQAVRFEELCGERELLFEARARFPERYTELTAKLYVIGCELAALQPRSLDGDTDGSWPGTSSE